MRTSAPVVSVPLHVVEDPPADERRMLRLREVAVRCGIGQSTVKKYVRLGTFPKPVRLAPKRVGWRLDEVDAWLASRERVA